MSGKKLVMAVVVAAVAVGALFLVLPKDKDPAPAANNSNGSNNATEPAPTEEFTATQVAQHSTESDCWTIISGGVYDVTSFISGHPGGEEILRACGQDATTLFTQRQTPEGESVGSGTPHSSSAESQLESLKIGVLAN